MRFPFVLVVLAALALAPAACMRSADSPAASAQIPHPVIDGQAVLAHTRVLASDDYEGRAPGTHGEDLTVAYITEQFRKAGLEPGNPDGTFLQKVPMVGMTATATRPLTFARGGKRQTLAWRDDVVAWTTRVTESVSVDRSDVVFVGYGVQAPEYNWDDFKDVDVKGKTMVVLVGDPPVPDPADPTRLDDRFFAGRAMTYYGRWTYKYEMGQKLGAAAVLIVHETEAAGYPFAVVQGKTGELFNLATPDGNMSRAAIEGWITLDQARQLFKNAGKDFDASKRSAATREFHPVALGTTASMALQNTIRRVESHNVIGRVRGSDPTLASECVIFTSHWDHFGIGAPVNGDKVYHGAKDNATGIGGLIELGRAFSSLSLRPKRSILFLAVTAEEQGLLGSAYYAANPLYPLARTLAVVNIDALNVHGRTRDLRVTGLGNSDLDGYASRVAAEQGRTIQPDATPEKGGFYRSDHFPFAQQGVPALASGGGVDYVGRPQGWGLQVEEEYTRNDYHKPSDVVRADWDMSGAVQDLEYYFGVAFRVAQAGAYPQWRPGTEFKAKRDAQLNAARHVPAGPASSGSR